MTMNDLLMQVILPAAATIIFSLISFYLPKLLGGSIVVRDFAIFIEGFGNRAKTKYLLELQAKKSPDSDGGVEVTPAEMSQLRQEMYDLALSEAKGPLLDYIKKMGPEVFKGLIGRYLEKKE